VQRCWQHGRRILAELQDVSDVDAAESLAGVKIWVPAEEVEVDEDEYLWQDLIGCEVYQADGDLLGSVTALEEYGAQDILTVHTPDDAAQAGEWMLPFIEDVIIDVDIEAKRITVMLPEGMDACFTPKF
jgi:16S rRNA processing protein RimM